MSMCNSVFTFEISWEVDKVENIDEMVGTKELEIKTKNRDALRGPSN